MRTLQTAVSLSIDDWQNNILIGNTPKRKHFKSRHERVIQVVTISAIMINDYYYIPAVYRIVSI